MTAYADIDLAVKEEIMKRLRKQNKTVHQDACEAFKTRRLNMTSIIAQTLDFSEELCAYIPKNISDSEFEDIISRSIVGADEAGEVARLYYDPIEEDVKRDELTLYHNILPDWEKDEDLIRMLTMDISIPDCKYDCTFNVEEAARMNPTMEALLRVAILGDEAPSRTKVSLLIWGCYASIRISQLLINKYRGVEESPDATWGAPSWEELWDTHALMLCLGSVDDADIDLDALYAIEDEAGKEQFVRDWIVREWADVYKDYAESFLNVWAKEVQVEIVDYSQM
jgi:hypothetical protein